jgi:hypothetical protein
VGQAPVERPRIDVADPLEDDVPPHPHPAPERDGADDGDHRERQHHGAQQREDRGIGHRPEQATRRPRQHVDRQESGDDDRDRVHDRPVHLRRRLHDHLADGEGGAVPPLQGQVDVLHHHDRAVDQDAEVDRADREEVGRDVPEIETDEGDEKRERNRRRDDEPRLDVEQEEDQHRDHQDDPAEQVLLHRARGEMDEVAPVVERPDLHVFREHLLVELAGHRLHALEHRLRLLAGAHDHDPLDRIVPVVEPELAEPRRVADDDLAHVADEHRRSVPHGQHDVGDILGLLEPAQSAHVVELPALGVEPAAGVPVVGAERVRHVADGQAGAGHLGGIEEDLILHRLAAEAREVRHPRHRLVRLAQDPVLDRLELHRTSVHALEDVAVDQAGG